MSFIKLINFMKKNNEVSIPYDFDIHSKKSFYRFFVQSYFNAIERALIRANITFKNKTIVNIGIGRGRELPLLKKYGAQKVVGVDINRKEIEYAEKKAKKFNIEFESIVDTPDNKKLAKIKDRSIDVVTLIYILNFIPVSSINALINHAKRILKPKGILIIKPVTSPSLMSLVDMIIFRNRTFYTRAEWHKKLQPLAIIQEDCDNYFFFPIAFMDILGKYLGTGIYAALNELAKKIGIPPSSRVFICQKK